MVEKPGSLNSGDLAKLVNKAKEKGVTFYINYQRSFDPRIAELLENIKEMSS